jgi:trimethylamine--corrinoid protein Co-methyltransferase
VRPKVKFLADKLIKKIINEAIEILCKLGVEINNQNVLLLLSDNGARIEKNRVHFTEDIIQKALKTAPNSFKLYDVNGNETNNFSGDNVHFTPGSAALHILDYQTKEIRNPSTRDYIDYVKVVSQLKHIAY